MRGVCDQCKWCVEKGCNEHEEQTGPAPKRTTDNAQPTTEALRSELDWLGNYIGGALPPATSAGEVIERAHRALYAVRDAIAFLEARAESAAKVRALEERHAWGNCVDRAAVLAALDADAPAETER